MEQPIEIEVLNPHTPTNKYEAKVAEAARIVQNVKNLSPGFQMKAFEIVLAKMLEEDKSAVSKPIFPAAQIQPRDQPAPPTSKGKQRSGFAIEIDKLLEEGFFNTLRATSEVKEELQKRGYFNRVQDVDAY